MLNVYVCIRVVALWDHSTLCDLNPSGRRGSNFLMGNSKWVVVLREYCLGGPLGFLLMSFVERELRSLILHPDLLFVAHAFSPHDFSLALYCRVGSNSPANADCVLHLPHFHFPLPQAGFHCGYFVSRWSRPKISCLVFSYFPTSIHINFLSHLVLFCSYSHFDISALLCYYDHSNICKYMIGLNTNVAVLLFCMCLLSQVLVFDPVRVGRV